MARAGVLSDAARRLLAVMPPDGACTIRRAAHLAALSTGLALTAARELERHGYLQVHYLVGRDAADDGPPWVMLPAPGALKARTPLKLAVAAVMP